jgi:hypothetical protein
MSLELDVKYWLYWLHCSLSLLDVMRLHTHGDGPTLLGAPAPTVWHCAQRVLRRPAPFFASPRELHRYHVNEISLSVAYSFRHTQVMASRARRVWHVCTYSTRNRLYKSKGWLVKCESKRCGRHSRSRESCQKRFLFRTSLSWPIKIFLFLFIYAIRNKIV